MANCYLITNSAPDSWYVSIIGISDSLENAFIPIAKYWQKVHSDSEVNRLEIETVQISPIEWKIMYITNSKVGTRYLDVNNTIYVRLCEFNDFLNLNWEG